MDNKIMIKEIINSKAADEDTKGDKIFEEINKLKDKNEDVVLDFFGIELVNTAFLNNAIGALFDNTKFNLKNCKVKVINMNSTMMDLLKESIMVARQKYVE